MTLRKSIDPATGAVHWSGEDSDDLLSWLRALPDCPPVNHPRMLRCERHDDVFCGYVQADPQIGIARRRCVACAQITDLFDSADRWTYPETFECPNCWQSLVELAVGISATDVTHADWLALAARCVGCGRISGLTDRVIDGRSVDEVLTAV